MKNIIDYITSNKLIANTAKLSISNIIMYALPIVVTPILSRIYSPSDFGEWGIFSSYVAIITIILFCGFENLIIKADSKELKSILSLCIFIGICTISIAGIIIRVGTSYDIFFLQNIPNKKLLILYLIAYFIYTIAYNISNRYEQYNTLSLANLIQGGSQAILRIIFGLIVLTYINGLILGTTLSLLITGIYIFYTLNLNFRGTKTSLKDMCHIVKKYYKFPLYDAPSSLLSFAAFNLPLIILSYFFDKSSIGCYSIIIQLLLMPMTLIGSSMGRVYYQELSQVETYQEISSKTTMILKITAIISIIPLIAISLGGDKIIILFLGKQWSTVSTIALCLSLWAFPTILTQPLLPIFRALNKQEVLLGYDSIYCILGLASIWICCLCTHNLTLVLLIYSSTCLATKLCLFFKILEIAKVSLKSYKYYILLWGISLIIFLLRLFYNEIF